MTLGVEPIHEFFGLSYANYLTLNRTVLQSMPLEWQERFVACLRELDDACDAAGIERAPQFSVRAVDWNNRYVVDPVPHYDRGRARVDLTPQS